MSDWKPGDVVRVTYPDVDQIGLIRPRKEACGALEVVYVSGGFDMVDERDQFRFVRRLVVIDPEDREQVERLVALLQQDDFAPFNTWAVTQMTDALHEFANPTPPKPDEPQGKWAVVVDKQGNCWIRAAWATPEPWNRLGTDLFISWAGVDADTVESEGIA